jgi:hypothetical protein
VPSSAGFRSSLLLGIGLLLLIVLAFAAVTILGRERWSRLRTWESVLARLSAAVVLAFLGMSGANVTLSVVAGPFFGQNLFTPAQLLNGPALEAARIQTLIGLLLALGVAAGGLVWIEMYHRRALAALPGQEGDDWRVEEPGRLERRL